MPASGNGQVEMSGQCCQKFLFLKRNHNLSLCEIFWSVNVKNQFNKFLNIVWGPCKMCLLATSLEFEVYVRYTYTDMCLFGACVSAGLFPFRAAVLKLFCLQSPLQLKITEDPTQGVFVHVNRDCLVAKLCPAFCDPMDCSTPGFCVLQYLPEFSQMHVHWIIDAIQPSHPLPPSSLPAIFPASLSFPMNQLFAAGGWRIYICWYLLY